MNDKDEEADRRAEREFVLEQERLFIKQGEEDEASDVLHYDDDEARPA